MKTFIISNRLPVKFTAEQDGELKSRDSEGGLATGLSSLSGEQCWIGWPGIATDISDVEKKSLIKEKLGQNMVPVFLSQTEIDKYYSGFSNQTIWPLFHSFPESAKFEQEWWENYVEVNKKFARAIIENVEIGDTIWIQDYHLMLLPQMIKDLLPDNPVSFFLHIPFPPFEIFNHLPWRKEILKGLLGADLIGFHVQSYVQNFENAVKNIMRLSVRPEQRIAANGAYPDSLPGNGRYVINGKRASKVRAYPMGIDFEKFNSSVQEPHVAQQIEHYKKKFGSAKLMLSVDRLDYTKGIPRRLKAFENLLRQNPGLKGKVSLVALVVPSRDTVPRYKQLKEEIDQLVGSINGRYATLKWTPIHYLYRSLDFSQLTALYNLSDICLVTPLRDGMNLVSKEYIACKMESRDNGVLVLSENAGAAHELTQSILINPFDENDLMAGMQKALDMDEEQQKARLWLMQQTLKENTIHHWTKTILEDVATLAEEQLLSESPKVIGIHRNKQHKRLASGYYTANDQYRRPVS